MKTPEDELEIAWVSLEKRKSAPFDMYTELLRFARTSQGIRFDRSNPAAFAPIRSM